MPIMNIFIFWVQQKKRDIAFWWFYNFFYNRFRFYITNDQKELTELYKLRYQVYCEEYNYISKNKTSNGIEKDEWDPHSIHFIIRDLNNEIAATVRLIQYSTAGFPIEKNFKLDIFSKKNDRNNFAEISRFIVSHKYRRHHLMFVLIKGIYHLVSNQGTNYLFSVMDDKLYPMLIKMGIPFRIIGSPSLYQGYTYPCVLDISEFIKETQKKNPRLLKYLQDGSITYDNKGSKYTIS